MWYVKISAYQHCVVDFTYMHPPPQKKQVQRKFCPAAISYCFIGRVNYTADCLHNATPKANPTPPLTTK